jgi:undecaprenyl-diphosphatase
MTIFHALILGIAQGLTEFLPVSSSAHLVIIPKLLGWPDQPLVFDTTLHLGTAAALIIFFWKDLFKYYSSLLKEFFSNGLSFQKYSVEARFAFYLLLSTIPASILALVLGDIIEGTFGTLEGTIITLLFGSALLFVADKKAKSLSGSGENLISKVNSKKSLFIGIMQSLALFPGVSRSGATISAGIFSGLTREEAARFSFMASVPIVLEAGIFQIIKNPSQLFGESFINVFIGFVTSFVVGILVIKFLMNYLKTKSLNVFIIYRVLLVVGLVAVLILR